MINSLTSSCSAISKDGAVVAIENRLHQVFCCSGKHLVIGRVGPVHCVEGELLVLLLLLVQIALVVLFALVIEVVLVLLGVEYQHLVINNSHLGKTLKETFFRTNKTYHIGVVSCDLSAVLRPHPDGHLDVGGYTST